MYTVQYTSATIDYKVLKRDLYSIYMDNTVILKKRLDIICKNNLKQTVSQDFVSPFRRRKTLHKWPKLFDLL